MEKFPENFNLNVEACAFTYLMAKTEAIMDHKQCVFFSAQNNVCGTAGCLMGHASFHAKRDFEEMENLYPGKHRTIGTEELFGYTPRVDNNHYKQFDKVLEEYVVLNTKEESALRNFKRLVKVAATEEEWQEFQRLTSLNPERLKRRAIA